MAMRACKGWAGKREPAARACDAFGKKSLICTHPALGWTPVCVCTEEISEQQLEVSASVHLSFPVFSKASVNNPIDHIKILPAILFIPW